MNVLALNAGSTSHKAELYDVASPPPFEPPQPLWEHEVDGKQTTFEALLAGIPADRVDAIGHRVVHPGIERPTTHAERIDAAARARIAAAIPLAPGHNRAAAEGISSMLQRFGDRIPQVAVYDTTLRDDAPDVARALAVPPAWSRFGVRRLGFHGISHHDVCSRVRRYLGDRGDDARIVTMHVGNGVSLTAFRGARAIETTMAFTPMAGTMMGTRSGSVDPGTLIYLLRDCKLDIDEVDRALNHDSGLLGVSGVSYDTRDILKAVDAGDRRAEFAWRLFAYQHRLHAAAMIAALQGIDAFAFTGPAGEHGTRLRGAVCEGLRHLGIVLDDARNGSLEPDAEISPDGAAVRVFAIRTLEGWAIARATAALL